ncbi:MAG: zf-HC2 domain-containing protein [Bacteroidetes bacterium]|jgi:mycothiol system anti-sigma-R factor|nr:zf-HC2 domain-containing protein [Bacteroidota bacterium]
MDCKETLKNLWMLLDGEIQDKDQHEILDHLAHCWHCTDVKDSEERLKSLIKQKLEYKKAVPSELINAISQIVYGK